MSKTFYSDAGKGSHARVRDIDAETYASNWDAIFGKKVSDEKKLEVFNANKVENFKASTLLEKPFCNNCGNTGKTFDGGWLYACRQCNNTGCNTAGEIVPVGD